MRSLASIAAVATLALAGSGYAQSLAEHAAAAAGATIGTAAGKPMAKALSGIFNNVDDATATAATTGKKSAVTKTAPISSTGKSASTNRGAGPGAFSPGFGSSAPGDAATADYVPPATTRSRHRAAQPHAPAIAIPVELPVAAEPVKQPSREDLAAVQIGTTRQDLFAALGQPESHITIPDDDGHMRESCQFWADGRHLGTVRLDNGQVTKVELLAQN
jgi:hypothetical protein